VANQGGYRPSRGEAGCGRPASLGEHFAEAQADKGSHAPSARYRGRWCVGLLATTSTCPVGPQAEEAGVSPASAGSTLHGGLTCRFYSCQGSNGGSNAYPFAGRVGSRSWRGEAGCGRPASLGEHFAEAQADKGSHAPSARYRGRWCVGLLATTSTCRVGAQADLRTVSLARPGTGALAAGSACSDDWGPETRCRITGGWVGCLGWGSGRR
jgi:hypothetical protein